MPDPRYSCWTDALTLARTARRISASSVGVICESRTGSIAGWIRSTIERRPRRLIRRRPPHLLERGEDGAASGVAEHHDEARAGASRRELDAADLRRRHDVAGHADDEQIAEPLIEHDLRRHAGVGTAENDGERFLIGRGLETARAEAGAGERRRIRRKPAVAFSQPLERFSRRNHSTPKLRER
jgi:hypothetical protein